MHKKILNNISDLIEQTQVQNVRWVVKELTEIILAIGLLIAKVQ